MVLVMFLRSSSRLHLAVFILGQTTPVHLVCPPPPTLPFFLRLPLLLLLLLLPG